MKEAYLNFYKKYSVFAPFRFLWDGIFTAKPNEKLSLINRQRDYQELAKNPKNLPIHNRLNELLWESNQQWSSFDYGEGYFYQSFEPAGVRGLRSTEERIRAMDLTSWVKNKTVLEIGANSGFLSLSLSESAKEVVGFDINPHLIEMGNHLGQELDKKNVRLETCSFEDWSDSQKYDVVLSFANHATYDENTKQDLESYFKKCRNLLASGGDFLFESHPPHLEKKHGNKTIEILENHFEIVSKTELNYGTPLDRGRTFIIAK